MHIIRTLLVALVLSAAQSLMAAPLDRPDLVVGIVVDQMRWDYLYRYYNRYGDTGFKRMLSEGYSAENLQIPYVPTVTAIGHTSAYTGTVPSIHGIAGNYFHVNGRPVNCVEDTTMQTVGAEGKVGQRSPQHLLVTTIGDELRMATNNRSRVVGVALKDRAAILPAGHNANGAYWFDGKSGRFVTSTYYMPQLPAWVEAFNKRQLPKKLLSEPWTTLYPKDTYTQSTADDMPYENEVYKGFRPTLPLDQPAIMKKHGYGVIFSVPAGNELTIEMAKAAIEGEQLGQRGETDMLCVSFSSTDYLGHQVGPNAVEVEDMYLRLDQQLGGFLQYLDQKIGRGRYTVFLTADHGAMNNGQYLLDNKIPAGPYGGTVTRRYLDAELAKVYPQLSKFVSDVDRHQVYFDREAIEAAGINYDEFLSCAVALLRQRKEVQYAVEMEKVQMATIPEPVRYRIVNGYFPGRSGDIQIIPRPGFSVSSMRGDNHVAWNPYDNHLPCLFMGWGVKPGYTNAERHSTDIAPTICSLLHIQMPSGSIGEPMF